MDSVRRQREDQRCYIVLSLIVILRRAMLPGEGPVYFACSVHAVSIFHRSFAAEPPLKMTGQDSMH